MSVQYRVRFYDAFTGVGLYDHPANGRRCVGFSGPFYDGLHFVEGTCTSVDVDDYGDEDARTRERRIVADDFDRPVYARVKGGSVDRWMFLVPDDAVRLRPRQLERAKSAARRSREGSRLVAA